MVKYYIDTEFLEGTQSKRFLGFKYGETKPTIDLISIGIVSEDGREYYAISKEFNLKEAWNRYELKKDSGKPQNLGDTKVYWIRDNVLKPIYYELMFGNSSKRTDKFFTYKTMKDLINRYGKTNKEIADDIVHFTNGVYKYDANGIGIGLVKDNNIQFYGYYCDYDWVVFCWLFGKMIDLPKGFPMYCRDLKQIADEIWETTGKNTRFTSNNSHNALEDARWIKDFHNFLNSL